MNPGARVGYPKTMLRLDDEARTYLRSRGYTDALIQEEELYSVGPGKHRVVGTSHGFGLDFSAVVFRCLVPSGALSGIHLASYAGEKRYEWRKGSKPWLPICYGSVADWVRLDETGELILVEGVFDRIVLKRCFPDLAVVARLSKSAAQVEWVLKRYAKRLWLAFDQDEAGETGARRLTWRVKDEMTVNRLRVLGKDPAEHAERYGLHGLEVHVRQQMEVAL